MREADHAIEEVRRSRREMSADCGHDPARLVQLLQTYNERYAAQVRRYQRRRRAAKAPAGKR
jgi:hypothetical protein